MTLAPDELSAVVALDAQGFYNPTTGIPYEFAEGRELAEQQIAAGYVVDGYDVPVIDISGPGLPMTEQERINSLAARTAIDLGLHDYPKSEWSHEQRLAYLAALRAAILADRSSFSPQLVAIAQQIRTDGRALDYSPSADVFFAAVIDEAERLVGAGARVGNGLISAIEGVGKSAGVLGALAPVIVPVAVVAFLYFAVQSVGRDPGGQFAKTVRAFA